VARVAAGIAFNEHTDEDGATVFRHACKMGLEGTYRSGLPRPTSPDRRGTGSRSRTRLPRDDTCTGSFRAAGTMTPRRLPPPWTVIEYGRELCPAAGAAWLHARLRSRWQAAKMKENAAIEPQPQETSFLVWRAARPIGVANKSEDGGIVVKLDPGEVVKSGNIFILYPVR
jgi:hypothetical protein